MKHVHPDGPDKNKVPAHVLGRLPKDIRYRVNTIGDVISEMGYTWYCQNAGRVTLRNTRIYDADAIMLPGRVSHELWASGKLMNYRSTK